MPIFAGNDPVLIENTIVGGETTEGPLTFRILKKEDFPNFTAGNQIVLSDSVMILHDDISLTTERFLGSQGGANVQMNSQFKRNYRLSSAVSGGNRLFGFDNEGGFDIRSVDFEMNASDAIFMLIENSGSFRMDDSVIDFNSSNGTIGTFRDSGSFQHLFSSFTDFSTGVDGQALFLEEIGDMQMIGNRYKSSGSGTGVIIRLDRGRRTAGRFISNLFEEGAGESALYISPLLDGALLITENTFNGDGDFFQKGLTGNIESIQDGDVGYVITGVTNAGGNAQFDVSTGTSFTFNGQIAEVTGFVTNTEYNGTGVVQNLTGTSMEIISDTTGVVIPFSGDDNGNVTTFAAIVGSTGHSVVTDDVVSIRGTINFNGGYAVLESDTNDFHLKTFALFAVGQSAGGEWDTGSLDQRDPRIECRGNRSTGGPNSIPDSMVTGGWFMSGNAVTTTVTATYDDIIFDSVIPLSYNERITATNLSNGELRYDGLLSKVIIIPLSFTIAPTGGGTKTYSIKGSIDRGSGYVDLPDNIETDVEAQGSGADQNVRIDRTLFMETGDRFKWQVKGQPTGDNFVVGNADIQI